MKDSFDCSQIQTVLDVSVKQFINDFTKLLNFVQEAKADYWKYAVQLQNWNCFTLNFSLSIYVALSLQMLCYRFQSSILSTLFLSKDDHKLHLH